MKCTISILAVLALSACRQGPDKPTVTIRYSPRFDSACSVVRGGTIKKEWTTELQSRRQEFDTLWSSAGSGLIEAAEVITSKTFPGNTYKARLTLCNVPSQSMLGITVNMRYALSSFTPTPVTMRYKVDTLFHEMLHVFLAEHLPGRTPLLDEHAAESERVREHLHLLALQKAVLLRLGETAALNDVVAFDSQLPGGHYKRAWEIVNATENEFLKFVEELK